MLQLEFSDSDGATPMVNSISLFGILQRLFTVLVCHVNSLTLEHMYAKHGGKPA